MVKTGDSMPISVRKGNVSVLKRLGILDKTQLHAVLATDSNGQPYTSMIAYALTPDMTGVIFATQRSTLKYKNILKNKRVSILIDTRTNSEKDYIGAEFITVLGNARAVRRGVYWSQLAEILANKHPKLNKFIYSPETKLMLVKISKCIHVTRFQTVSEWHVMTKG